MPELRPNEEREVGFRCRVTLSESTGVDFDKLGPGRHDDIPARLRARYTSDVPNILNLRSGAIRTLARRLSAGHRDLAGRVAAIHDHLAGNLVYDRDGRWDPAPVVLERGSGSCSEFSYAFVALCRASGVPARFVGATFCCDGEATRFPHEDRIWHRWVQVYLPGSGWVHVDVTRDRGPEPKREFLGRHVARCLILSHGGGDSRYLGDQYVSTNSHAPFVVRRRVFVWEKIPAIDVTASPPATSAGGD